MKSNPTPSFQWHTQNVLQAPPIKPSDNQLSLDDLDSIKVIGKGSSGIVQLVRHKWTGQFFALKVLSEMFTLFFPLAYDSLCLLCQAFVMISLLYLRRERYLARTLICLSIVRLYLHQCIIVVAGYTTQYSRRYTQTDCPGAENKLVNTVPTSCYVLSVFLCQWCYFYCFGVHGWWFSFWFPEDCQDHSRVLPCCNLQAGQWHVSELPHNSFC
jgi:hypothetical protein